jgi:hypothetical protein
MVKRRLVSLRDHGIQVLTDAGLYDIITGDPVQLVTLLLILSCGILLEHNRG